MRATIHGIKIEDFVKSKLRNRRAMLRASNLIDDFRKKHGKVKNGFDAVEVIRKMRDSRR